ncbi:MAG: hypothetical protein H6799_03105 [Candidatus Nomurabacteria bacterium]|nr:MAG: hypothetical protein H6799_03105 [Candidatus Nomurabacteria bacterium]
MALKDTKAKENVKLNIKFYLLTSLAVIFLLIANSALWVNRVIFNTNNFSEITAASLLSESSRKAVSSEVVDQALSERPVLKSLAEERATNFISSLLKTSQVENSVNKVSSKLQLAFTSNNNQNIEFDLSGIKQTTTNLINLSNNNNLSEKIESSSVPDKITLLDTSKLPKFYNLGTLFMWLAPITFILGVLILAYPHIKQKKILNNLLWRQGLIVLLGYLLGLLLGPLFRPLILSQFKNINLRVVAENLYNSFVGSFNSQIQLMLFLGLTMVLVPLFTNLHKSLNKNK